jgi:hypothetical protein
VYRKGVFYGNRLAMQPDNNGTCDERVFIKFRKGRELSFRHLMQLGFGAHVASCRKAVKCEAKYSPSSGSNVKKPWNAPPLCADAYAQVW